MRAGVLAQLRLRGDWMTYVELVDAILAQHRVTLTPSQRKHFLQKLREGWPPGRGFGIQPNCFQLDAVSRDDGRFQCLFSRLRATEALLADVLAPAA